LSEGISLIVGLGNPGESYANTRHNAGFRFISAVLKNYTGQLRHENKFGGDIAKVLIAGREVWLLVPMEYMNLSGTAVSKVANFYKIEPKNILVAHDELDIPPGAVRLKIGGGHGGHNGLRDIVPKLGSSDFVRLRIGIGHPGSASKVSSYVLNKAPSAEATLTDTAIDNAVRQLEDIVCGNYQKVMNELHTHNLGNS